MLEGRKEVELSVIVSSSTAEINVPVMHTSSNSSVTFIDHTHINRSFTVEFSSVDSSYYEHLHCSVHFL